MAYLFTSQTPTTDTFDGTALTVGMKFKSAVDGRINKFRFWKSAACTETFHKLGIWNQAGDLLLLGLSISEPVGVAGWVEVTPFAPLDIVANTPYTVGFWCNSGYFSYTPNVFIADVVNGNLTGMVYTSVSPGNGVGAYTVDLDYPTGASAGRWNYFADVDFEPHWLQNLSCDAVSTPDNWNLVAGANKVAAVAPPPDDDTTYITSSPTANTQQQVTISNPTGVGPTSTMVSVNVIMYVKRGGSQDTDMFCTLVLGGNTIVGTTRTSTSAYQAFSEKFYTKPGGGDWTLTDVQNLEIRIQNVQGRQVRCSTLYVELAYEPSPPLLPPLWADDVTVTDVATVVRTGGVTVLSVNINETVTVTDPIAHKRVSAPFISLIPSNPTPTTVDSGTGSTVTVGTLFSTRVSGTVFAIETYRGASNTSGISFSQIWVSSTGANVGNNLPAASQSFGYQRQYAPAPYYRLDANVNYVVGTMVLGNYSRTAGYFTSLEYINGPLKALKSADDPQAIGNGRLITNASIAFPNTNPDTNAYYHIDILFSPDPYVEPVDTITVTDVATISVTAIGALSKNTNESVAVTEYTRVRCTTYVSLIVGNPTPTGVHASTATATVGVIFRPAVSGSIVGYRFYMSAASGGIFNSVLYDIDGNFIGSGPLPGQTNGWNNRLYYNAGYRLNAGQSYVAGVNVLNGRFAYDTGFFTSTGLVNGVLSSPKASEDFKGIGNGRYIVTSGFPNTNPDADANYWVDVLFVPDPSDVIVLDDDITVTDPTTVSLASIGNKFISLNDVVSVSDVFTIVLNPIRVVLFEGPGVLDTFTVFLSTVGGSTRTISLFEGPAVTEALTVSLAAILAYAIYLDEDPVVTEAFTIKFNKWVIRATEDIFVTDFTPAAAEPYVDLSGLTNNLQWLITIYKTSSTTPDFAWTNGEERVIDLGAGGVFFTKALADDFQLGKSWSDILYGISVTDDLSFSIDNSDGAYTPQFYTSVQAGDEWRGAEVRAYRYDWGASVKYEEFIGVLESFEFGDTIKFDCITLDTDLLQVSIPREIISTANFPRANVDSLGLPINVIYGYATNIPCYQINQYLGDLDDDPLPVDMWQAPYGDSAPVYDYLVGRGNLGVDRVYRDGVEVVAFDPIDGPEYSVLTALYPGFTVIRFHTEQTDFSGAAYFVTADVHGVYSEPIRKATWKDVITGLPDLIAYYRLNRGDVLSDDGPNELNGSLALGSAAFRVASGGAVPGDHDYALDFANGITKYTVPDSPLLDPVVGTPPKPFGIIFCFRHNGTVTGGNTFEVPVAKLATSPFFSGFECALQIAPGNVIMNFWDASGTQLQLASGGKSYCDDQWHVVCASIDPPGGGSWARLWVDFTIVSESINPLTLGNHTQPLTVGIRAGDIWPFRGALDELVLVADNLTTHIEDLARAFQGILVEYKFNGTYLDNGPKFNTLTYTGAAQTFEYVPGFTGYGQNALKLSATNFLILDQSGSRPLMTPNWGLRLIFKTPATWGAIATAGWVMRGPYSTRDDGDTTNGWGLAWAGNASTCSYTFNINTVGAGPIVINFANIGYDVWHDIYISVNTSSTNVYLGSITAWMDGNLIQQEVNIGRVIYQRTNPYVWGLQFGDLGLANGWQVELMYLAFYGINPLGDPTQALDQHYTLQRNGIQFIQKLLTNDQWGLKQQVDSTFETAKVDWEAVNAGQGIPVDMELVEPTNTKDILDSVLRLRGGRLYRSAGNTWGIEIDKPADLTQQFRFGQGDGQANNIVNVPTIHRSSLADMIKTLAILYRSDRDVSSGQFSAYTFTIEKEVLTRGTFFLLEMPALHDHRAAIVFGEYYSKKLISADERLSFECEEMSGRLAQPGSLAEVSIPRWGINKELYRIQSIKKGLDKHDIELFKYDSDVYTAIPNPELPVDPTPTERYPEPKLGDWVLCLDPILVDSVLIGIEARPLIRYNCPLAAIISQQCTSWPVAANNLLYMNDNNVNTQIYAPAGTYPKEDVYTVNGTGLPTTLKEASIQSVDIVVQVANRTADNTGTYRIKAQIASGTVLLVKEVTMHNQLYPQYEVVTETYRLLRSPQGGAAWTIADIQNMRVYLAIGTDALNQKGASIFGCQIKVSTYPTEKLPLDFDSWMLWRRNAATPVPNAYKDAPQFNGKSNLFYDTTMDGTGMTTLYYHMGMRNRQGLMSTTTVSSVRVNLTT